jgi:hypothetical protein
MVPLLKSSTKKPGIQRDLQQLIEGTIQHGVLSRRDHLYLTTVMLSDQTLSASDRNRINQIFDLIRMGRVRLED